MIWGIIGYFKKTYIRKGFFVTNYKEEETSTRILYIFRKVLRAGGGNSQTQIPSYSVYVHMSYELTVYKPSGSVKSQWEGI